VATKPKETKAQSRERLRQERARQAAAEARRQTIMRIGLIGIVVLAVAAVGIILVASRGSSEQSNAVVPKGITDTKGYPTGTATAPVLDIWEDFQCPICGAFEATSRDQIEALATSGTAKVVYHTWNFLDRNNVNNPADTQQSSSRAAMAAGCAWDQGKFLQMHDQIYENQPADESTGWTDTQLETFAKNAGVADMGTFDQCLSSRKYAGFLTQVNAQADKQQVTGTPTFFVNGTMVDLSAANGDPTKYGAIVIAAVEKAAGASSSPSPTSS
jgi:protein-disulfide isomerase